MTNDTHEKPAQNYIAGNALLESDLAAREGDIVAQISIASGFKAERFVSRSGWWVKDGPIGAFHYAGSFEGKPAILKVQGIKPTSSEAYHIKQFQSNADRVQSSIRPPHLYYHSEWDDTNRYEVLILEELSGNPVVAVPATPEQLETFFKAYSSYRRILTQEPWVAPETEPLETIVPKRIEHWMNTSLEKFPDHPLRKSSDSKLIQQALEVLRLRLRGIAPEFQHGHFSHIDVYEVGNDFVALSNLYWSWRLPMYDAVFAYHWHRFSLPGVPHIKPEDVDKQKNLWLSYIANIPQQHGLSDSALSVALLERSIAGIAIDGLSADRNHPVTAYILDTIRDDISRYISELS